MSELPTKSPPPADPSAALEKEAADKLIERLRAATTGEYDIYGELGRGGMATVYLAHEISLDRKVAIKVMAPAMVHGAGLVERFKREARTAASLSHPNIIPIYAVRQVDDLLFCVIKLVKGTPLDAIVRELGKLPIPMVRAILAQVGDALGYAHRHGVVHRDVKPANILIDDDGWAVVTDFGIAKVPEMEGLTMTGIAVGTPTYMSPEQGTGSEVTGAADQYSLGVVAYEMLTGRPPFTGTNTMAVLYSHFHDTPPPLETLRPDCPPDLSDAVMRMLAKDPEDRWPSVEAATAAMGAKPLARDDPTRSHLITLARSGNSHRIVSQLRTPQSPIPLGRKPTNPAATRPATRTRPALLSLGALILLGAGYVIAKVAAPGAIPADQRSVTEANVASPARDSVTTPPVDSVRPSVPTATAPESTQRESKTAAPPPADRRQQRAANSRTTDSARVAQRQPNAATSAGSTATPAASKAESSAVAIFDSPALRAQVNAVPLATPPRQQQQSVTAPPVDEQAAVQALIQSFARAVAAKDLAAVRRLYPTMPNDQREGFEELWRQGLTLTPRWTVSDIVVDGNFATVRVRGTNVVSSARGPVSEIPVDLRGRLVRREGEWRLLALVN
jgi:serine/threonine protein kinase